MSDTREEEASMEEAGPETDRRLVRGQLGVIIRLSPVSGGKKSNSEQTSNILASALR